LVSDIDDDSNIKNLKRENGVTEVELGHFPQRRIIDYNEREKLKKAISENGSSIVELFTRSKEGLADQMNTIIESAIGTKGSLRDRAGIEGTASVDQNILSKAIKELNEKITTEKEKLATKETNYYKMFSSMESAMTSMDSQLSALQSMLGM